MMNNDENPLLTIPRVSNFAYMWAVFHGQLYDDGYFVAVFDTKKEAEKAIRNEGYIYNKELHIYITYNDKLFGDARWYRIDKTPRNNLF